MALTKGCKQLVAEANALIRTIPTAEAIARLGDANTVFVDLRDVRELEREGMIPGAFHAPRGLLEYGGQAGLANLHLDLLQRWGAPITSFGDYGTEGLTGLG